MTYSQGLGIHAVFDHGDADGEGPAVEVAVLGVVSAFQLWCVWILGELTRMVAISWRMSTACWAAACFSARSLGGILEGYGFDFDVGC